MRILKLLLTLAAIFVVAALLTSPPRLTDRIDNFQENLTSFVEEVKTKATPLISGPLKSISRAPIQSEPLSPFGIIAQTNIARSQDGAKALTENSALNRAAQAKLNDMFAKQYFDHISPSGVGPGDLAEQAGYNYVVVGENLALGNFDGDSDIVNAWMNSPGHRENILSDKFTEIGVAVKEGNFEGDKVWIAVQEFGRPVSSCPIVDESLRSIIESQRIVLENEARAIDAERAALDALRQAEDPSYNSRASAFNARVATYNALVKEIKQLTDRYNAQIADYNRCV